MTPDSLLYCLADTLNIDLHEIDDRLRGAEMRRVKLGPFALECEVVVVSDVLEPEVAALFARIQGNLWLYLVSRPERQWLFVFDASLVGLHVKDATAFGGRSVAHTLQKLRKAITTGYVFETNRWSEQDVGNLVHDAIGEGPVDAVPGAAAVS